MLLEYIKLSDYRVMFLESRRTCVSSESVMGRTGYLGTRHKQLSEFTSPLHIIERQKLGKYRQRVHSARRRTERAKCDRIAFLTQLLTMKIAVSNVVVVRMHESISYGFITGCDAGKLC